MPNTTYDKAPLAGELAVQRIWDAALSALMARHILGVMLTSGASHSQTAVATKQMGDAFNSLLIAVRELDASTPLIPTVPTDACTTATHRLLPS